MKPNTRSGWRAIRRAMSAYWRIAALAVIASCDSPTQPVVVPPPDPPRGPALSTLFVISNAVARPSSGQALLRVADAGADSKVVYVSLPPASIPDGLQATIRAGSNAISGIRLADGGFDPTPIAAGAGDTIVVLVTVPGSADGITFYVTVPPAARPRIVRTIPPRLKRDVPLNSRMVVVFSEPINASVLADTSITLRKGGTAIAGRITFGDADHTIIEFTPSAPLESDAEYELVVTQSIRDTDGGALEAGESVSFATTAAPTPTVLSIASVANQAAEVGRPVAAPPIVRVLDGKGNPVPGVTVQFNVVRGGNVTQTVTTKADGTAAAQQWVMDTVPGLYEVRASVAGVAQVVTFQATANPGPPAFATSLTGMALTADGAFRETFLLVRVTDRYRNPVPALDIGLQLTGASRGTLSLPTMRTDATGLATVNWTLASTTNTETLVATVPGLPPLTFSAHVNTCTGPVPYVLGDVVNHEANSYFSCPTGEQGMAGYVYRFTLSAPQAFTVRITPTIPNNYPYLVMRDAAGNPIDDRDNGAFPVIDSVRTYVLGAGTYQMSVSVGDYESSVYRLETIPLTTAGQPATSLPGCVRPFTARGATISGVVDQSDCSATLRRYDQWFMHIVGGESITLSAPGIADGIFEVIETGGPATAASSAQPMTFTPKQTGYYTIRFYSTRPEGASLPYILNIR